LRTGDSATLKFADGLQGTINYFTNGSKLFPKEQLHIFCGGKVLFLDNFKKLTGTGFPLFRAMRLFKMDKGHKQEVAQFVAALKENGPTPIAFDQIVNVSRAVFAAMDSIREGRAMQVVP